MNGKVLSIAARLAGGDAPAEAGAQNAPASAPAPAPAGAPGAWNAPVGSAGSAAPYRPAQAEERLLEWVCVLTILSLVMAFLLVVVVSGVTTLPLSNIAWALQRR